jgi:UDP-N-acetylglucosamine 1-carboxyvinyltransferase
MDEFVIEGGTVLRGEVTPSGNKNAAFPLIAATLLTDRPVLLRNLPDIEDVRTMLQIVEGLGVRVTRHDAHAITIQAGEISTDTPDPRLLRRIRGALVLIGPLLARLGRVRVGRFGGDQIGRRRIDTHVTGLQELGVKAEHGADLVLSTTGLSGEDLLLEEASVTATENIVLAAALARGTTVIRNAASEPHVQQLCELLNAMGARVEGIASNTLTIEGVASLHGAELTLGPDFMEVGSLIALGAIAGENLVIRNAAPEHMRMTLKVFGRLGVRVIVAGNDLVVPGGDELRVAQDIGGAIPSIDDGPWPAFPADLMSAALVAATQAHGTVLFHEKMYESRLFFVDRLIGMGARIVLCDPHRALVSGPSRLRGEVDGIASPDIRAGVALLMAALVAEGKTVIRSVHQIDRGYERLEEKLAALGARIARVTAT